jgi:hypothetical protein
MKIINCFVLFAAAALAQIPAHTPHFPGISNFHSLYGWAGEPSGLVTGMKSWAETRFDMVVGGGFIGPTDGHVHWMGYEEMADIPGFSYLYPVQDFAEANGFVLEDMLLHSSIDAQYTQVWWSKTDQFGVFEGARGVWTYASCVYTDVTANSYDNAHHIPVSNTLYVGYMEPFDQMNFAMYTARVGGSVAYTYWNGSIWTALTPRSDTTSGLTASGKVYFYPPSDWARTVVNGSNNKYWVRISVSGASTAPVYSKLYGDNWAVSSGANNARGWNSTDGNRINIGTRLEYNPTPPANASAKFRYQARVVGTWASNYMYANHANVQKGVLAWGKYLVSDIAAGTNTYGYEGVMLDDGTNFPNQGQVTAPANWITYLYDRDQGVSFTTERLAEYAQVKADLHAAFGSNYLVGSNTTDAAFARAGDWSDEESYAYSFIFAGANNAYTVDATYGSSHYDSFLPANNPTGSKAYIMCYDTPAALTPGINSTIANWHYWDRGNRSTIGCLAQHYMGSNVNTGFSYYSEGGFIYNDIDEVYTFSPATALTVAVAADTSSSAKVISLASVGGCSGSTTLQIGNSGDSVGGSISGSTFHTTSAIYNSYPVGAPAYCIQKQHQSAIGAPPVGSVWRWGTWYPAMGVDIGVPDPNGMSGGARIMPWKTGGSPDYISGQSHAACNNTSGGICANVNRRDFTKAIVLLRGQAYITQEVELDTLSQPISLDGTYYPLKADGTTGPGITSIQLRSDEGAILMKHPVRLTQGPPPVCDAGKSQVFRAGSPAQLDGTGSSAMDGGGVLSYLWQQLSGPRRVRWGDRSAARTAVSGLVFGSYVFQLTVTDSSDQSSTCTVKDGAVATDMNGVVVTNNPAVDTLLGPLVRLGANPWPWFDDRHRADADFQIGAMDTVYPAWWDAPGPGTVRVTAGSNTITGTGTTFSTTFCQGPANPAAPKTSAVIAVWYNTGVPGQTGRRMSGVTGCTDDTHLTVDDAWDSGAIPAGSGLSYAADDATTHYATNWGWGQADSPGNYYDNVAAYYALYYRSGIDDYLTAAHKLADRVWRSPMIDRGASEIAGHAGRYGYAERSISALGLVLRALELQGMATDMWPGLHHIWDTSMAYLTNAANGGTLGTLDTRGKAYHLAMVSYCALYDSDPAYRANCQTAASNSFANIWTPSLYPDGSWPQLFYTGSSWDTAASVSLINGSQTVAGNGTAWIVGNFPATIWFTNDPANRPANNSAGDAQVYGVTFVDASHLRLDRPYEGTSGIHGWASVPGTGMLGWGAQPAQMGVLAFAFDLAAKALAGAYPQEAALAQNYRLTAANWIRTYGYWPLQKGLYLYAQGINCQAPISDANSVCTGGNTPADARALSAQALRGVMAAYAASQDSGIRDFADTLYNAMFAKPNTCTGGTPCVPDGYYVSGLDPGGYMMTGAAPLGNAWFGMFFGFNNLSAWPAYRVGGLQPVIEMALYTSFNPGQVRGALSTRLTATAPSGSTVAVECSSSPCAVPVDSRQGKYLIELQYLSSTGAVLATTGLPF